jgi:hypothetical protein
MKNWLRRFAPLFIGFSLVITSLKLASNSFDIGAMITTLFMAYFTGCTFIINTIPQHLNSIQSWQFNVGITLFTGVITIIHLTLFSGLPNPVKVGLLFLFMVIAFFAGIVSAYPFRKLKSYLEKKNLIS